MKIHVEPITIREANDFVVSFHRHSQPTHRNSGRFALAACVDDVLWGVAVVGRPLSRELQDGFTAEVLRVCARPGAPRGTCSFLYGRCWRVWQMMGGHRMVTYTLADESGASLRGAGWHVAGEKRPSVGWKAVGRENRKWDPVYGQLKFRWEAPTAT